MTERRSKATDLAGAISTIQSGARISLGGNVHNNVAMAAVRELIRNGPGDLELIAFGQGAGADVLIGAGNVARVHTNYIGLEHLGLAPCFRRAAESGTVEVVDWDSLGMVGALAAAAEGAPFAAVPEGIEVTAWPELSPEVYRRTRDPFTGREVFVVPPLRIDVALLYASTADPYGNAQHRGFVFWDELIAQAADRVIVVCEEVVAEATGTTIPGYLVDLVVASPRAAYPGGAPPAYASDLRHLEDYRTAARSESGLAGYLAGIRDRDEQAYIHAETGSEGER